jgi:hypothetical protein
MDWRTLSAGGNNSITAVRIGYATTGLSPVSLRIRPQQGATGSCTGGTIVSDFIGCGLPPASSSQWPSP